MTDILTAPRPRLPGIDIARGVALIGMVVFHFTFDLEYFGLIPSGTITSLPWRTFARLVAGSFVFLAGVSLVLAARGGLDHARFWRDTGKVALAALAVSVATWFALGPAWVFFGILHAIALSRVLGLAFLRLPAVVVALVGAVVWALPYLWQSPVFDSRWLAWFGFAEVQPLSMDLEPVFPWFGPFLLGMAFASLFLTDRRPGGDGGPLGRALAWAGQRSLPIYLIHQPVLLGLLFLLVMAR